MAVKSILRGLGSHTLICGCVVGLYETYRGGAIAVLDIRGAGCADVQHRPNTEMDPAESVQHAQTSLAEPAVATRRTATITCPQCGCRTVEAMPVNACLYFFLCAGCETLLKPKHGDCCVFCSYADRCCEYC